MSVCVYSVFVLPCVQVAALRWADPPSKESYQLRKRSRNWKIGQGPTKGYRHIDTDIVVVTFLGGRREEKHFWPELLEFNLFLNFLMNQILAGYRDSVVGTATSYGLDDRGVGDPVPVG
jgi:hypothetical protein